MTEWQGKRVLVTGAAGFVGANLVHALIDRGAEVHALVRSDSVPWRLADCAAHTTLPVADLKDYSRLAALVRALRPAIIFHSAARRGHPADTAERLDALADNVMATATLIEALRETDFERLVHLGSSTEYGLSSGPMVESQRLAPFTYRGATKAAATLLCLQFAQAEKRPVVVLRPFSVFGYWEADGRLVPTTMLALLRNAPMALTPAGFRRDFIFIEDVVEASLLAATRPGLAGEIINLGTGRQYTNEALVALAQEAAGVRIPTAPGTFANRQADVTDWVADTAKASALLGWQARFDLRTGLQKTFAWFRDHRHLYER